MVTARGILSRPKFKLTVFWTLPKLLKIELLANFSERGDTNDYLSKIILSKVDR
jgi:hypothetical protein